MQNIDKPVFSFNISVRTLVYALILTGIVAAIILGPKNSWWEYKIDPLTFLALTAIAFYMEKIYRHITYKSTPPVESKSALESTSNALVISEPSRNAKRVSRRKK
jgi:hypothetical protein